MDNTMSTFEDVLFELYINENIFPLSVKAIDRSAVDIRSEAKRYERELRQAKRKFSSVQVHVTSYDFIKEPPKNEFERVLRGMYGDQFVIENYQVNSRKALAEIKMMRNGDLFMPEEVQKKLGISVDPSAITIWAERHIKWQACAQTLWFFDPMANIKIIQDKMLSDRKLYELLDLGTLTSIAKAESRGRGLEDVIREVNPNPGRKGRPSKKKTTIPRNCNVVPIPKVYNSTTKKLNCKGLKIAIVTISQVLALQSKGFAETFQHPIINAYKALTSPHFEMFIDWWIEETSENS